MSDGYRQRKDEDFVVPEMDSAWRDKAFCLGRDTDEYMPHKDELPKQFLKRVDIGVSCPSSCPVRRECARDALFLGGESTVRAGSYLPQNFSKRQNPDLFDQLVEVAGGLTKDELDFASLGTSRKYRIVSSEEKKE